MVLGVFVVVERMFVVLFEVVFDVVDGVPVVNTVVDATLVGDVPIEV